MNQALALLELAGHGGVVAQRLDQLHHRAVQVDEPHGHPRAASRVTATVGATAAMDRTAKPM
jgi:hypothetical protein